MIDYKEKRINYMILNFDDKFELLIRAEENKKEQGIIIVKDTIKEIKDLVEIIKDYTFSETIEYLDKFSINYKEVKYM